MKEILKSAENIWINELWTKLDEKLSVVGERSRGKIPFSSKNGIHMDMQDSNASFWTINWWTNGFWPGLMWLMYAGTGKEDYRITAEAGEKLLDKAFDIPERLSHDVGFIWKLSAGPDYALTGNHEAWQRLRKASHHLMSRYNPVGEYLRAWDWGSSKDEKAGWTIIDTMMNLPLLYWASEDAQDPRFKFVAMKHADKTMNNHVRADGSVKHIVVYDPYTGETLAERGGQGYEEGSSWSRGQAWAIYGFTLSYIHTGKQAYLDTAKKVAHYFIANVCEDWLPKCDFRSPDDPVYYDASAGLCAACGFIELAKLLPKHERRMYLNAALHLLKNIECHFADWSLDTDFIVRNSTSSYVKEQNVNLIYADYFFAEAIYKLKGYEKLFW